jgi:4-hydroxybenzoate polyprenyltransferase
MPFRMKFKATALYTYVRMERASAYLGMMRIRDWIRFYPLFPLLGGYISGGISAELAVIGVVFFCVTAYGFVVNNFYDVEIDRQHQRKRVSGTNPLVTGQVTGRGTVLLMAALVIVSLAAAVVMSTGGFFWTFLCLAALTLYSAPPFRLKDRAFVDIVTHGLMFGGLPLVAGWSLAGGTGATPLVPALICTAVCAESLIAHQINDYFEDLGTATTTVVQFGLKAGWSLLGICMAASLVLYAAFALASSVPWYGWAAALIVLLAYPAHSCRDGVWSGARSAYHRAVVATLQLYR